jgi:hypothetical protein
MLVALGCAGESVEEKRAERWRTQATHAQGSPPCTWGVDELLAEVGAAVSTRASCGSTGSFDEPGVARLHECFLNSVEQGVSREFTVNACIDCQIPNTFVWTPRDGILRVVLEEDYFGDELRETKVEACSELKLENGGLLCVEPVLLYACEEPLLPRE